MTNPTNSEIFDEPANRSLSKDTQSRKYLLTINNPIDKGLTHDFIKSTIQEHFTSIHYYCMSDEVGGKDKTHHTHVFLLFTSPVRFSQLKKYFSSAHIDKSRGSAQANRDYVFKEGKNQDSEKSATNLRETHFESGELPDEPGKGSRTDLADIHARIKDGLTTDEIIEEFPEHVLNASRIENARQLYLHARNRSNIRNVFTVYVHGKTETGKTRSVIGKHDLNDVYRLTSYKNGFDHYNGEDVLILDEFHSPIEISRLLNILDVYPVSLDARYSNKSAAYTRVYIISNEPLHSQYSNVRTEKKQTWNAFKRRIHLVVDFDTIAAQSNSFEKRASIFAKLVDEAYEAHMSKSSLLNDYEEPISEKSVHEINENDTLLNTEIESSVATNIDDLFDCKPCKEGDFGRTINNNQIKY